MKEKDIHVGCATRLLEMEDIGDTLTGVPGAGFSGQVSNLVVSQTK